MRLRVNYFSAKNLELKTTFPSVDPMSLESTAQRTANLKAQLATKLQERRTALLAELESIDTELRTIDSAPAPKTSEAPRKRRGRPPGKAKAHKSFSDSAELHTILSKAEGKRLNRKGFTDAGYSLKSAIAIAKTDRAFGQKQNRAQGEVWLK